jgi:hypothetical protein
VNYYNTDGQDGIVDWAYLVIKPLKSMLIDLVGFIPNILAALLILFTGWVIAHLCRLLVGSFLKSVGFNSVAEKIGISEIVGKDDKKIAPNQLVGLMAFWGVIFTTVIIMLTSLRLSAVSSYLDILFSYVITVLIIAIIAVVGIVFSMIMRRIIRSTAKSIGSSKPELPASIARWAILIFTGIVCLSQMGINLEALLMPAGIILTTLCITFILAFGLGGKHWAEKMLDKIGKR